jgi:GT2 family glycosyltransferase
LQAWGGGYVNFCLGRSRYFLGPVPDEKIQFLTGASLLLRRSALESLGLLDEDFFLYWEDADYCFRLRTAGWRLAVAGGSKVWHKETATVGKNSAKLDTEFNRSAARFFHKHAPRPFFSVWVGIALRIAKRVLIGDWKRARAVWAGVREAKTSL